MALNYLGYPPRYLNPRNMYYQAAADAHHQRSVSAAAAHHQATHSGVPGSNPAAAPHHHAHQMYLGLQNIPCKVHVIITGITCTPEIPAKIIRKFEKS